MIKRELTNQTFLITGASSGIGARIAEELAIKGAHLILAARRVNYLNVISDRAKKLGASSVTIFPLDLSNLEHIDRLLLFIEKNNLKIDGLINSAGVGYSGPFVNMEFDDAEYLFRVNVLGLMYLTQQIAIQMIDQGKGEIVNLASLAGKVPTKGYAVYAATKAAIIAFSHALRMELKNTGVHLTVVNFGPVKTSFFDHIEDKRKEKSMNSFFTLEVDEAAEIVVKSLGKNKREINRPFLLNLGHKLYSLAPQIVEKALLYYFD